MLNKHRGSMIGRAVALTGVGLALAVTGTVQPAVGTTDDPRSYHVEGRLLLSADGLNYRATGNFLGTYRSYSERFVTSWPNGPTTVKLIEGIDSMRGCVDRNRDGRCGVQEPSGTVLFAFQRLATFDSRTGDFVESSCTHSAIMTKATGRGRHHFSGGRIFMTDRVTGSGGEITSTYRGDLTVR